MSNWQHSEVRSSCFSFTISKTGAVGLHGSGCSLTDTLGGCIQTEEAVPDTRLSPYPDLTCGPSFTFEVVLGQAMLLLWLPRGWHEEEAGCLAGTCRTPPSTVAAAASQALTRAQPQPAFLWLSPSPYVRVRRGVFLNSLGIAPQNNSAVRSYPGTAMEKDALGLFGYFLPSVSLGDQFSINYSCNSEIPLLPSCSKEWVCLVTVEAANIEGNSPRVFGSVCTERSCAFPSTPASLGLCRYVSSSHPDFCCPSAELAAAEGAPMAGSRVAADIYFCALLFLSGRVKERCWCCS